MLVLTATSSLLFTSIGLTSSQASTTNLTYEEFASSPNYIELSQAAENFLDEMRSKKYMNMTTSINTDVGSSTVSRMTVSASTAGENYKFRSSSMDLQSGLPSAGKTSVLDSGFVDGLYFGTIGSYASSRGNFPKSTLARLGKPKAKLWSTKNPDLWPYLNSAYILTSASQYVSAWTIPSKGVDDPNTRYSEVIKTPNTLNALDTDYTFDIKIPYRWGPNSFTNVHSVVTLSSDGQTYAVKVNSESPYWSLGLENTTISSVLNIDHAPIQVPDLRSALELQKIADMITKISLEQAMTSTAKSISNNAVVLASKDRKQFSSAHLVLAAKQYHKQNPQIKYSVIKGGVKLSYTYFFGITANLCVTVLKYSTKIKIC
jgi:hypothetical protein